jgi:hypothetical protein
MYKMKVEIYTEFWMETLEGVHFVAIDIDGV